MANNRKCIVDNTEYEYCGNCARFNKEETWRYIYCSENCKGIYGIYDEYRQGRLSANDAVEQFKAYQMPPTENFHSIIKPVIEKIYAEATPVVETSNKNKKKNRGFVEEVPAIIEEPVAPVEEIVNEIIVENPTEE